MALPYTKCGKCGNMVYQPNRYGQISYPWHKPALAVPPTSAPTTLPSPAPPETG